MKMEKLFKFTISYKHPKKRKLYYKTFWAENMEKVTKMAPRTDEEGRLIYGIH